MPNHLIPYFHTIRCTEILPYERGINMGAEEVRGGYGGGLFTNTGSILVLFILLVIITCSFC